MQPKGRGRGEAKTSPKRIEVDRRRQEALQLRTAGFTYEMIAEKIGVSPSRAYEYVKKILQDTRTEAADEFRSVLLERLETALRHSFGLLSSPDPDVRVKAINEIRKLVETTSKLFGLNAPERHEIALKEAPPEPFDLGRVDARAAYKRLINSPEDSNKQPRGNGHIRK